MNKVIAAAWELLDEKGYFTQGTLAEKVGCDVSTISREYWGDLIESEELTVVELYVPSGRYHRKGRATQVVVDDPEDVERVKREILEDFHASAK